MSVNVYASRNITLTFTTLPYPCCLAFPDPIRYAPHIRNIHVAAILAEVESHMAAQQGELEPAGNQGAAPTVLFVGDLNSDLNSGIPGGQQQGAWVTVGVEVEMGMGMVLASVCGSVSVDRTVFADMSWSECKMGARRCEDVHISGLSDMGCSAATCGCRMTGPCHCRMRGLW